jgi:hypothetical protein
VVEEPGDFPCLKSPPFTKKDKELIDMQHQLRAIYKISPYHTKPATQEKGIYPSSYRFLKSRANPSSSLVVFGFWFDTPAAARAQTWCDTRMR